MAAGGAGLTPADPFLGKTRSRAGAAGALMRTVGFICHYRCVIAALLASPMFDESFNVLTPGRRGAPSRGRRLGGVFAERLVAARRRSSGVRQK
ncbi:hypothetical protein EYF80_030679 [Liparis tanakae]|uniref:Uncharacterized protein n=1 Tax=Liparis tanakae TaxID=230148 RepID=A0A4Z2H1D1_9TELE|nr:hypothetical protein EYF80_030679 [Liparis tanakae]